MEVTSSYFLLTGLERKSAGQPGRKSAVQHGDIAVTEPAQQPPGARRNCPAHCVIANHVNVGIDTEPGECHFRIRDVW